LGLRIRHGISLNQYPIKYPDLDVDFLDSKEAQSTAFLVNMRQWERAQALKHCLGKGSFLQRLKAQKVLSQFQIGYQRRRGNIIVRPNINLIRSTINARAALKTSIASFALGNLKPFSLCMVRPFKLRLFRRGIHRVWLNQSPVSSALLSDKKSKTGTARPCLAFRSQALGLAAADSKRSQADC